MEEKIIFIALESLVKYPSKDEILELKEKYCEKVLEKFSYEDTPGIFASNYSQQVQNFIQSRLQDERLVEVKGFKAYEESTQVLNDLKAAGFRIIVTSDSSHRIRPLKVLNSCGLSTLIDSLVTFSDINTKKSSPEYFQVIKTFLNLSTNIQGYVVASKLYKELPTASSSGLKPIWINQQIQKIVQTT